MIDNSIVEFFYDVKYWNVNYLIKCSSENCWFLVHCFFSVIWNISQINVFKTKCKLKCQNDIFGKLFLKSGNTSVYISFFHYWDLSNVSVFDIVKLLFRPNYPEGILFIFWEKLRLHNFFKVIRKFSTLIWILNSFRPNFPD